MLHRTIREPLAATFVPILRPIVAIYFGRHHNQVRTQELLINRRLGAGELGAIV
jgi:hypothetical protein